MMDASAVRGLCTVFGIAAAMGAVLLAYGNVPAAGAMFFTIFVVAVIIIVIYTGAD